jgi:hypothetical protein
VFGPEGFQDDRAIEQLNAFASRAYRRPLTDEDRLRITKTYEAGIAAKTPPRQAALDTLKMILCSPSFIYLPEITPENEPKLNGWDLASRLSYTLWTAPPDQTLRAAAQEGTLAQPEVLKRHVLRMLNDDRAAAFVNGFLDAWLNLRDLGNMPPPRQSARAYYAEDLPTSMKEEARRFFTHLLRENGSAADLIDADYTFVDKKLAKLYQLPEASRLRLADGFQRVSLKGNRRRGGVLGMAAVLTVSANGVDTSPVTRGVFVCENILGTPPPPPPDEVPAIGTDVRGATTIRERLEKHRGEATCAECHRKIDPLGFGLETFDPIGRWRDLYPKPQGAKSAPKVDASGEFPSGETFGNFTEFKQVLAETRLEPFVRHLVAEVLTYGTGRHMQIIDQFEIDEIANRVRADNNGLRTLIVEALTSEIFRSR